MISLTPQERIFLIILVVVFSSGSVVQYAFKKYPFLKDIANVIDHHKTWNKLDINQATQEQLVQIPYIGTYTAQNIIAFRELNGPFTSLEQLKDIKGIKQRNFERFSPMLKVENRNRHRVSGAVE